VSDRDETKLCPFCRQVVPYLAAKCRFCGEMIGVPLHHVERHLTESDLGGMPESKVHYSGRFVQAYEELKHHQAEAEETKKRKRRKLALPGADKIILCVVVAGLVVVSVFSVRALLRFQSRVRDGVEAQEVRRILGEADAALEKGDYVTAIQAAHQAVGVVPDSHTGKDVLSRIRVSAIAEGQRRYDEQDYAGCARFCKMILQADPGGEQLSKLLRICEEDAPRYSIVLNTITRSPTKGLRATFRRRDGPLEFASKGEQLGQLGFTVLEIDEPAGRVKMRDDKRGRTVVATVQKQGGTGRMLTRPGLEILDE
jgi:hypothetical protein